LAKLLNSDKSMDDADQLIRLPGYLNTKLLPHVPCRIVQADASIVYTLEQLAAAIPLLPEEEEREPAAPVDGRLTEGNRHPALISLGGTMRRRGMDAEEIDAALQAINCRRCDPPLDEAEVRRIAECAAKYQPADPVLNDRSVGSLLSQLQCVQGRGDSSLCSLSSHPAVWPMPMGAAAFRGLAGRLVSKIEPHSEADPAALLIHLIVMFGNVIGRTAYFEADGARHFANLFAVNVGQTSKGRKGTAQRQVERMFRSAAADWVEHRSVEGLSSGEGLIWAVRDPIFQRQPIRQKGRVVDYQDVQVDAGVSDKRLLVCESEFAGTLKVAQRETNTLSPVVRRSWDKGSLRTLTKNSPAVATDAHISILAHITRDELRRCLDRTETANGFCNRFLWLCVKRSKCLPEGGEIHAVDFGPEVRDLAEAIESAKGATLVTRDGEARELWAEVYADLSAGRPGLLGAVLSRAEAQVMRLAMVYALLDQQRIVREGHLRAALAVWEYCEASAAYIFGSSLGDRDADGLLAALRSAPDGLSRKQITVEVFAKHRSSEAIERALAALVQVGLARRDTRSDTGGRPEERWFATVDPANKANKAEPDGSQAAVGPANKANEANKGGGDAGDSSHSSLSSHPPTAYEDEYDQAEREAIRWADGLEGGTGA
jgi:hypothetical protein